MLHPQNMPFVFFLDFFSFNLFNLKHAFIITNTQNSAFN